MRPSGSATRSGAPAGSSRAAVRELVLHLERVGFDGAPRYLGLDDQGREVLTWIEGDAPLPPYPAWAMTDRALADLGGLIRRLHEATATFRSPASDWSTEWADPAGGPGICHNDLFPENVVFRDGRPVALIDFAMAPRVARCGPRDRGGDVVPAWRPRPT